MRKQWLQGLDDLPLLNTKILHGVTRAVSGWGMLLLGQGRRGTPRVSFLLQIVAGLPFGGLELHGCP